MDVRMRDLNTLAKLLQRNAIGWGKNPARFGSIFVIALDEEMFTA